MSLGCGDLLLRLAALALSLLLVSGCATQTRNLSTTAPELPVRAELPDTPFFPQDRHQCGPASLAIALAAAGYPADPADLESRVYLAAREGSLQMEMQAAARRHGALAVQSPPTLAGLFAEIVAGTPVIILQNLGLEFAPRWHYAVVIGYDRATNEVMLRSGTNRHEVMAMSTFEHTWARSGYWGMVVFRPGKLPQAVDRAALEKILTQLEKYADPAALLSWYEQAVSRWQDNLVFLIGLGNAAHAMGQIERAEQAFRAASDRHPQSVIALNNLATVLHQRGKLAEALAVTEHAVALGGEWQSEAQATRAAIQGAIHTTSSPVATGADATPVH